MRWQPDRGQVVIRLPDQDLVVKLQDESASGLSAVLRPGTAIHVNDQVQIRTSAGWFDARVVQLKTVAEGLRVGLERGQEVAAAPRSRVAPWWVIGGVAAIGLTAGSAAWLFYGSNGAMVPVAAKSAQPLQVKAEPVTRTVRSP